jgi:uncharacterized protein
MVLQEDPVLLTFAPPARPRASPRAAATAEIRRPPLLIARASGADVQAGVAGVATNATPPARLSIAPPARRQRVRYTWRVPQVVQLIPYICVSAAIVSLWLTRGVISRFAAVAAFMTLAAGSGMVAGVLTPQAFIPVAAFGVLCWAWSLGKPDAMRVPLAIAVAVASLVLMAHVVPGINNVLIVKGAIVSPGAAPFTLYLNFDKALIALFILGFGSPSGPALAASRADWVALLRIALPRIAIVTAVMIAWLVSLDRIHVDVKWPPPWFFPFWVWANLLFTCAAEEAVFRGIVQRAITGDERYASSQRVITGVVVAASLFGLIHFPQNIVPATIAGAGYGWVYWASGNRIEASILAHFLLNLTHILFFTYPALTTAIR